MNDAPTPMPRRSRALWHLLVAMARAEPRRTTLALLIVSAGNVSGLGLAYAVKRAVDAASAGDRSGLTAAAVVVGFSVLANLLATYPVASVGMTLRERAVHAIEQRMIELVSGVPGLEHHERPEYLDRVQLLLRSNFDLAEAVGAIVDNVATVALVVASTTLLAGVHPALALLPLAALPAFFAGVRRERMRMDWGETVGPLWRLKKGLREDVAWDPSYGPELRLGGAAGVVLRRQAEAADTIIRSKAWLAVKLGLLQTAGDAVLSIAQVAAVAFVAVRAVNGVQLAGDVVLTVVLAGRVSDHVVAALENTQHLHRLLLTVARLQWLEVHATQAMPGPAEEVAPPARLNDGVHLQEVSFRYPGTEAMVLDRIDLHLPAGSIVAVVGENGAGKTTLVKLLTGFYHPTSGRIMVDDTDLTAIPPEQWRTRVTAAFQDFARPELTVRETVGIGDVARWEAGDPAFVDAALHRAGATSFVADLPDGVDTRVGRRFVGGIEPSGGQWQKLALARALVRDDTLLFILDEPTAALDPQAEHHLFDVARAHARANRCGGVTVFVSHRFSTVRLADLIVVIEDGRLVEQGRHDDLLAAGGRYAELFTRQARAYR